MGQYFRIHPENPQLHLVRETVSILNEGGVIVYPTDSAYAIGCVIGNKQAIDRIRRIRQLDEKHNLTLMCRDLSELSLYAKVDNDVFRFIKAYTPGPYTYILPATKEVPRRLQHPKRKTIGLRVPDNAIAQAILEGLESPMLSSTMILPGHELPLIEPEAMLEILGKQIDLVIDGGYTGIEATTVIDFTSGSPEVIRYGKGDAGPFGG